MFKILDKVCKPTKGSKYSACIDLYAREDVIISAGETKKIPLGVCIDIDKLKDIALSKIFDIDLYTKKELEEYFINNFKKSHYIALYPRSSIGAKGLIIPNGCGIIDLDYSLEIMLILHNSNKNAYKINKGDKIAQIMLKEHKSYLFGIETNKQRDGGFGSTGK